MVGSCLLFVSFRSFTSACFWTPHIYSLLFFPANQIHLCLHFQELLYMFALCCYPSLSIKMLIPANNWPCVTFLSASLWHFLLQPSHYEWRMPQALMEWMCCAFQSFPAKTLELLCSRLEVLSSSCWPLMTSQRSLFSCLLICAHSSVVSGYKSDEKSEEFVLSIIITEGIGGKKYFVE